MLIQGRSDKPVDARVPPTAGQPPPATPITLDGSTRVLNRREMMVGQRRLVSAASWDREVASSEVPVLVEFWSRDSAPCRFEEPVLEAAAQSNRGLKILRVDVDSEPALVARFEIRALPTVVLFVKGVPVHRMIGYHEPRVLNEALADHLS